MNYYRLKSWGRPSGPWRQLRMEAEQDGVDRGDIHVDDRGCVWFGIRVEIEQAAAAGPPLPRELHVERLALRPVAPKPERKRRRPKRKTQPRADSRRAWAA